MPEGGRVRRALRTKKAKAAIVGAMALGIAGGVAVDQACLCTTPVFTDTSPPGVVFGSPVNGATISGVTNDVNVDATDNVGVFGVQFKIDGANFGAEDTTVPYQTNLDSTTLTNASHTISAVARDAANNTTTVSVTVTVNNVVTPPDPNPGAPTTVNYFVAPNGSDTDATNCVYFSTPRATPPGGAGTGCATADKGAKLCVAATGGTTACDGFIYGSATQYQNGEWNFCGKNPVQQWTSACDTMNTATANVRLWTDPASTATPTLTGGGLLISGSHYEMHGPVAIDTAACDPATYSYTGAGIYVPPPNCWTINIGANCPTTSTCHVTEHDIVIDSLTATSAPGMTGGHHVTIKNSSFIVGWDNHGIVHCTSLCPAADRPHDLIFTHNRIVNQLNTPEWTSGCPHNPLGTGCQPPSGQHMGCGPTFNDTYNVVWDSNYTDNCTSTTILIKPNVYPSENILITNSYFGTAGGTIDVNDACVEQSTLVNGAQSPSSGGTLNVDDIVGFGTPAGSFRNNGVTYSYTGTTATSFTGVTPGGSFADNSTVNRYDCNSTGSIWPKRESFIKVYNNTFNGSDIYGLGGADYACTGCEIRYNFGLNGSLSGGIAIMKDSWLIDHNYVSGSATCTAPGCGANTGNVANFGLAADNLHLLSTSVLQHVLAAGLPGAPTTDYDGDTRSSNPSPGPDDGTSALSTGVSTATCVPNPCTVNNTAVATNVALGSISDDNGGFETRTITRVWKPNGLTTSTTNKPPLILEFNCSTGDTARFTSLTAAHKYIYAILGCSARGVWDKKWVGNPNSSTSSAPNDEPAIRAAINYFTTCPGTAWQCVDPERVWVTGQSTGGNMTADALCDPITSLLIRGGFNISSSLGLGGIPTGVPNCPTTEQDIFPMVIDGELGFDAPLWGATPTTKVTASNGLAPYGWVDYWRTKLGCTAPETAVMFGSPSALNRQADAPGPCAKIAAGSSASRGLGIKDGSHAAVCHDSDAAAPPTQCAGGLRATNGNWDALDAITFMEQATWSG